MLSRGVLGAFALGVLWLNTLLVVAASWQRARALRALARRAATPATGDGAVGLARGRVVRGRGADGALAVHRVEQVGRFADDGEGRAIAFHDRRFASEAAGGVVAVARDGDGEVEYELEPASVRSASGEGGVVEVWPDPARQARAAACASVEAFDAAYAQARRARGFARTVAAPLAAGDAVWIVGEWTREAGAARRVVRAPAGAALWISATDPRAWIARRMRQTGAFIALALAGSAAVTALALSPPAFGAVSTAGAALGLVYFLGVLLPLGASVQLATRTPDAAHVRGRWTRPGGPAATTARASGDAAAGTG